MRPRHISSARAGISSAEGATFMTDWPPCVIVELVRYFLHLPCPDDKLRGIWGETLLYRLEPSCIFVKLFVVK